MKSMKSFGWQDCALSSQASDILKITSKTQERKWDSICLFFLWSPGNWNDAGSSLTYHRWNVPDILGAEMYWGNRTEWKNTHFSLSRLSCMLLICYKENVFKTYMRNIVTQLYKKDFWRFLMIIFLGEV